MVNPQRMEAGVSFIELTLSDEARTYFYTEYHPLTFGPEIFGRLGYHLLDYSQPCIFSGFIMLVW